MLSIFGKFLPEILLVVFVSIVIGGSIYWYNKQVNLAYERGYSVALAEVAKATEKQESIDNKIIEEKSSQLEELKVVTEIRYKTLEKEIIKYVEKESVKDTCLTKPLPDDFIGLLNNLSDPGGKSSSEDTGKPKEEVSGNPAKD